MDMAIISRFLLKPAVTPPGSKMGVCSVEKVSQTPSEGWSHFDTEPITQPHLPHTQMGNNLIDLSALIVDRPSNPPLTLPALSADALLSSASSS